MSEHGIPKAALDAAAKVYNSKCFEATWESLPDWARASRQEDALDILEAAAPHMQAPPRRRFADPYLVADLMAKGWDEGIEAGVDGSVPECDYARNPYRNQSWPECPPRTEGDKPHCPDCSGIVGETGIV